ncbi:MAG TPA: hypothetical protein VIL28_01155 [Steroidobacteraceae bacterium]
MDSLPTDLTAELPKLLGLAIAFVGALLAVTTWWRRHRSSTVFGMERSSRPAVAGGIVYHDAPTVRVIDTPRTDSQRVDRVRKIVRVTVGEFVDILPHEAGPVARFRITLKNLLTDGDAPAARIVVEYGGTTLSCGPLVQELGHNDFVLPRTSRDDPRTSVVYFHERGDTLDFMRIKLRNIYPDSQTAEIDVMQVCGNWPH